MLLNRLRQELALLKGSLSTRPISATAIVSEEEENQQCDANDSEALLEFRAGFIPTGSFFDTWIAGTDCCQWKGVNCTSSGRVQGLTVDELYAHRGPSPIAERNASYEGEVGASLADLSELRTLDLILILFDGPMPNFFDKLYKLEQLTLQYNNFSGSLSPSIGGATSLKTLRVDGQAFSWSFPGLSPAPIPPKFCQLKNLQTLVLNSFLITGKFPECFCQFGQLTDLELTSNNLEGVIPSCIGSSLGKLQTFSLSSNKFVGPIPTTLGRLANLQTLSLDQNKLVGNIPPAIGSLATLQSLSLTNNSLSGPIPAALGNLGELNFLELSLNSLTRIPPEIGKLVKLSLINLSGNKLQGRLPPEIQNIGSQEGFGIFFDISNNRLSGPIPDIFSSGYISLFFASNNLFTGGFPLSLGMVGNIDLSNNLLSDLRPVGTLPPAPKTYFLNLGNNRLSGPVPSWLENFVASSAELSIIDISVNKFTGPLSAVFFEHVLNFNASYNMFTGEIPVVASSTLSFLDLSHNGISGPITSTFIGSLLNTTVQLDLSFNELSGPLPANSGDFLALNYLDLSDNMLTGEVPASVENITSLSYLDLSDNQFTGNVPSKRPPPCCG
ncbi:hypothetical protein R1flu_003074 [Riccia fluitans]|uniref:Leucine-rich repeat-containing N-terminal plant-type domain-containing protein n=1 Tax=Riccia fluitans TaxID=41844 RepID=A0ABD1Y8W0_9MARC